MSCELFGAGSDILKYAWCDLDRFGGLDALPAFMRGQDGFVNYLSDPVMLPWNPVVISDGGVISGLIFFTDYDADNRCAQVHFVGHGRCNLLAVVRRSRRFIDSVLMGPEVDLLHAFYREGNVNAERMAVLFGFVEYARVNGGVYRAKCFEEK